MENQPSSRGVSQRDLAKMLGVSHVTVSMALRNNPRVSESVRKQVNELAAKLGYRPDPMLSALANYRLNKPENTIHSELAWINAWPQPDQLYSYKEFLWYCEGASKAAARLGYRLEEFRLGTDLTPMRLHEILAARGIRGILLPPSPVPVDWDGFPFENYSLVRYGHSWKVPACHLVTADQFENSIRAFVEIRKRGYRRIGFVTDESELTQDRHRFESGFLSAQRRVDAAEQVPVFVLHNYPFAQRRKELAAWMEMHQVDAIFTTRPETRAILQSAGLRIPKDVAMAATTILDTTVEAGIDQHPEEIGRVGFLMLYSLMNDDAKGIPAIPRQTLVEGSWVDGASLPDKNASSGSSPARASDESTLVD